MNGAKRIFGVLRRINSVYSTQLSRTHPLFHQVTLFSHYHVFSSALTQNSIFKYSQQNLFFSTESESTADIVLSNEWSKKLEKQLENSNSTLTHETVMYVLKKLHKHPEKASKFFDFVCGKNGFKPSSSMHSLMLRILAKKESMMQFWVTIRKMKEQGFHIDEETYQLIHGGFLKMKMANDATALKQFYNRMLKENALDDVVKEVVQVVMKEDWGPEVEKKLGEMKISVSDDFLLRALRELKGCRSKALRFFKWVGERPSYEHNSVTYNAIARVLGWDDSIEEFWDIVKEMTNLGHEIDLDTYIKISRRFQKRKMLKDAVELYELMMDGLCKPSVQDCSFILQMLGSVSNPNLDLVFRVVKKFEAAGHSLSKNVYYGIHRSLTSVGRFDEAEKIVETMRDAGYEPDNITYSQLIYGLCKARKLEEAREIMNVMEANGCVPDIKTWTVLIKGHCATHAVDEALFCFAKMMEKNCDADGDLLDVLINGFLSLKRIVGAYKFLVEMVKSVNLRPWQATYKNLIQKLLGESRLEEALELLGLMKRHNYPPFPEPFIEYISKFGTIQDATAFFKALSIKEYPSVTAYVNVFQSFFQEGRHSEAKDLLHTCPHHIREHKAVSSLFRSAKGSRTKATAKPASV